MTNMKDITPIIDQLYWKHSGDEYQLVRQTQASETVFFIATQAEYEAITQAARIAELEAALENLQYYVGNPSAWEYYDDEISERIRKACEVAEPQFWMAPKNRDT